MRRPGHRPGGCVTQSTRRTEGLGEAFTFDDLEATRIPFEDLTVSVASPATLYRMKRNTVRLKDRADAELLKERFRLTED